MKFAPIFSDSNAKRPRKTQTLATRTKYEVRDESPAGTAERIRQFDTIKDLLTADTLGTS